MGFDLNAANKALLEKHIAQSRPLEQMFSVQGKTAIVTGGTSGLGFNIALRLLQGGAKVVLAGRTDDRAEYALPLLAEQGFGPDRVIFCKTDVRNEKEVEALINKAAETFGSLDIYVNSAAVWSYGHVYDLADEEYRRVIETNLVGAFHGVKFASKYMIEHGIHGKITLISSNSAWLPYPVFGGYPHYASSKGGVNSLTVECAKELKRYGIMVNAVAPGGMVTSGSSNSGTDPGLSDEKSEEMYDEMMVWQYDGQPPVDTVAIVAYAMCTPMSDGMTGEVVTADDGMTHNIVRFQPAIDQYPEE